MQVDPTLLKSMIDSILVDLFVPKIVPNLFILERLESMLDIIEVTFVNSLPVNQFCPTLPTFTKFIGRFF
jgi:hypothetical protein